jgi:hypothetical protein
VLRRLGVVQGREGEERNVRKRKEGKEEEERIEKNWGRERNVNQKRAN